MRKAIRYTAVNEKHRIYSWGTCLKWARDSAQYGLNVTSETVMVVNPRMRPCGYCGGSHADLPMPNALERS